MEIILNYILTIGIFVWWFVWWFVENNMLLQNNSPSPSDNIQKTNIANINFKEYNKNVLFYNSFYDTFDKNTNDITKWNKKYLLKVFEDNAK